MTLPELPKPGDKIVIRLVDGAPAGETVTLISIHSAGVWVSTAGLATVFYPYRVLEWIRSWQG